MKSASTVVGQVHSRMKYAISHIYTIKIIFSTSEPRSFPVGRGGEGRLCSENEFFSLANIPNFHSSKKGLVEKMRGPKKFILLWTCPASVLSDFSFSSNGILLNYRKKRKFYIENSLMHYVRFHLPPPP